MKRYLRAIRHWLQMLLLLMAENFAGRYRSSRIGAFFAIFEPFAVIVVMTISHLLLATPSPYGSSDAMFFSTGILPFYLCFHSSLRSKHLEQEYPIPRTTSFDYVLANMIDEIMIKIFIMTLCFGGFWFYGYPDAVPRDMLGCLAAFLAIAFLGFSVGTFNAIIEPFFHGWHFIYVIVVRSALPLSGLLVVIDRVPDPFRTIALYNPLIHGITWFRYSFYAEYPHASLNIPFLLIFSMCLVSFSLIAYDFVTPWRAR